MFVKEEADEDVESAIDTDIQIHTDTDMDCEEYNGELNKPLMCVTCGQTACSSCFLKVRKEV